MPLKHVKLDNTMVECFNRCPRKFYWRHVRHKVKSGSIALPLSFGSAIHTALEVLYKGATREEMLLAFMGSYGDVDDPKGIRTTENGLKILEKYHDLYFPEQNWNVLHTEDHTAVELTSDILFVGKIDLIVEYLGIIYIVDHKTTGNMWSFIAEPCHQFTGYVHNAQELGFNCQGAIVNLIGVFKVKTEFQRPQTMRSPEDIVQWKHYVCDTKSRMDDCFDREYFPIFSHSCFSYGSNCPYMDLCLCSPKVQDYILEGDFKEEKWEPWKAEDEKLKKEVKE